MLFGHPPGTVDAMASRVLSPDTNAAPADQVSVLLVHGIRTSASMWRTQVAYLRSLGVAAHAVDLPGHGTRIHQRFTLPACRAAIEEAWRRLPPGRRILVGLSLGGYLGLDWAARTPSDVDAVLAAGCTVRPRGLPLQIYRRLAGLIHRLPDHGKWLNDQMVTRMLTPQAADDVGAGGVALHVMVPALRAMSQVEPLTDLHSIRAPVWLVNGAWDHFRLEERRFWRAVHQGRLIVVPRSTHLVSLDRPAEFNSILRALVEHVAASARQ